MNDLRVSIKNIIENKSIKQCLLANRSGIAGDKLCRILNLTQQLRADEFMEICKALGMTAEEVANGCGERA